MPYAVNADLPPTVRSHLPEHAQDIFREAFNHAHAAHAHDPRQEEAAFRIAWAAVKRGIREDRRRVSQEAVDGAAAAGAAVWSSQLANDSARRRPIWRRAV